MSEQTRKPVGAGPSGWQRTALAATQAAVIAAAAAIIVWRLTEVYASGGWLYPTIGLLWLNAIAAAAWYWSTDD